MKWYTEKTYKMAMVGIGLIGAGFFGWGTVLRHTPDWLFLWFILFGWTILTLSTWLINGGGFEAISRLLKRKK